MRYIPFIFKLVFLLVKYYNVTTYPKTKLRERGENMVYDKNSFINISNIICYLRRSRQDEERERKTGEDTLSTQKKIMVKVLDEVSLPYETAEEIGSGDKIESRPVFKQVLEWLKEGKYDAIAVKEIARLGRGSYSDMGFIFDLLKEKRIYIITPYKVYDIENPTDARQIRFELFLAREEFEMIRERMLSSKIGLAHEGRWVVGAAPFGYQLNHKLTRLEPKEDEAELVRMIFDLYVNGRPEPDGSLKDVSFRAIANYLNNLGIPSPRNGNWQYQTVKRVIENPAYIGTLKYRTRKRIGNKYYNRPEEEHIIVEQAHEPIISKDLWDAAQEKLNNRPRVPRAKLDFSPCELAGLVVCSKCGRRMVRQYSVQHYKKKDGSISVYHKEFLWCTTNGCTFVKYRDVEKDILAALETFNELDVEELKEIYGEVLAPREQADVNIDVGEMVKKKERELRRRLEFIFDKYEKGIYSDEDFLNRKKTIETELKEIKELQPNTEANKEVKIEKAAHEFKENVKNVLEFYKNGNLNKTEKNELLLSVIEKVELTKTGKGTYELDIIPRPLKETRETA